MNLSYVPLRHNAFLATMFVAVLIVSFAGHVPAMMGGYLALAVCTLLANVNVFSTASRREQNVALATVLVISLMLPISMVRSVTGVIHYVVVLVSMGAGFLLS